jgi:hypothetical protein
MSSLSYVFVALCKCSPHIPNLKLISFTYLHILSLRVHSPCAIPPPRSRSKSYFVNVSVSCSLEAITNHNISFYSPFTTSLHPHLPSLALQATHQRSYTLSPASSYQHCPLSRRETRLTGEQLLDHVFIAKDTCMLELGIVPVRDSCDVEEQQSGEAVDFHV